MKKHLQYSISLFFILIFSSSLQAEINDVNNHNIKTDESAYSVCPPPSGFNLISTGKDSAVVNWTTGGATAWQLSWGPVGFVPGTNAHSSLSNTYTISGLDSLTCYDVYVRDSCGTGGDVSTWVGPITFCTTGCSSACFYTIEMRDNIGGWQGSTLRIVVNNGNSQFLTLPGALTSSSYTFAVCDGATVDLSWLTGASADDNSVSFDLKDAAGQVIFSQGAYPSPNVYSFTSNCSAITCFQPNSLGLIFSTSNNAVVNWVSGGASNWQVEVRKCGDTVAAVPLINSGTTSAPIAGLESGTCYEVYVRDSCGVGDVSVWSAPLYFTTDCDTIYQAPYYEDFENSNWIPEEGIGYANSTIDACWDRTTNPVHNFTWVPRKGSGSMKAGLFPWYDKSIGSSLGTYMYLNDGGVAGDSAFLVSPSIDLSSLILPELHFWYHRYSILASILDVQVSNDGGSSWTTKHTITGKTHTVAADPWLEAVVDLSQFINDTVQVRFKASAISNSCCSNQSIDNVSIVESCLPPTLVSVDSVESSKAFVSWTSGSVDYIIEWGTTGFTQGMGTVVRGTSIDNQHIFTGLQPSTCYDFYIRDSCTTLSKSVWVGPFAICTPACAVPNPIFTVTPAIPAPGQTNFAFDASLTTDYDSLYWDFGDGATNANGSVLENHTYTAASNGGVVVTLTACKKCTDNVDSCKTTGRSILINGIGTEELSLDENVEVYPNPHNGDVFIDLKTVYESIEITVFNFIGQAVLYEEYTNTNSIKLTINGTPGVYTIQVKNAKGEFYMIKSVKQ